MDSSAQPVLDPKQGDAQNSPAFTQATKVGPLLRTAEKIHFMLFRTPMGSEMRRFVKDLSQVFMGGVVSGGMLFLTTLLAARWLGPSEFGKFQLIISLATVLVVLMEMTIDTSLMRILARTNDGRNISTAYLIFGSTVIFVGGLAWIFQEWISAFTHVEEGFWQWAIGLAVATALYSVGQATLRGLRKMKSLAWIGVVMASMMLVLFIIFSRGSRTYEPILVATLIGYLASGCLAIFITRRSWHPPSQALVKPLLTYSLLGLFVTVSMLILMNANRVLLNFYFSPYLVGIYAAYFAASNTLVSFVLSTFSTNFFPAVAAATTRGGILRKLDKISGLMILIMPVGVMLLIRAVFFILGSEYPIRLLWLFLFALNITLYAAYSLYIWFINAEGTAGLRRSIRGALPLAGLFVILGLVMIPRWGITGAILASTVTNALLFLYFRWQGFQSVKHEQSLPKEATHQGPDGQPTNGESVTL